MAAKNNFKVGAFFLVGLLSILVALELSGTLTSLTGRKNINVYFDNIGLLEVGAIVKMAGVRVGKVSSIGFAESGSKIKVGLSVVSDKPVTEDTEASIRISSLLGTSYVNLSLGSPGSPPLKSGASLMGRSPYDVNNILQDMGMIMTSIATGNGTVSKLLYDGKLYTELTMAAARLNSILAKVDEGQGAVGKLINDDSLYIAAGNVLKKTDSTLDTLEDIAPLSLISSIFGISTAFK